MGIGTFSRGIWSSNGGDAIAATLAVVAALHIVCPRIDDRAQTFGPAGVPVELVVIGLLVGTFLMALPPWATRCLISAAAACAVLFTATAIVNSEGEPTSNLVLKPFPTFTTVYQGDEGGSWEREYPGEPRPWFLAGGGRTLLSTECNEAPSWMVTYVLLFLTWVIVSWGVLLALVGRRVWDIADDGP